MHLGPRRLSFLQGVLARPHLGTFGRLRALVRGSELWLMALAIGVGVGSGLLVTAMSRTTQFLHQALFGIPPGARLSGVETIQTFPGVLMPAAGGILLGLLALAFADRMKRISVDPIEANALHGGRMSIKDSILVTLQTMISSGFGASVGLEAGYTQISSGFASRVGLAFRLRRNDMRILVGCGAAAAIAAAFDAPLTGAFYAFELIIGTYSIATVTPVMASALVSVLVSHAIGGASYPITVTTTAKMGVIDYPIFVLFGIACAGMGILVMRGVALVETLFKRSRIPRNLCPFVGGLAVGALAIVTPQILSSGHGALHVNLLTEQTIGLLAMLLVLKILAAAISLGAGFRGGLFFASLFLGAVFGKLLAGFADLVHSPIVIDPTAAAVVGMGAFAVAVIGGPLTMAFLALETTGDFSLAGVVLAAAIVASLTVRETFGYSFSTWRFHLRGETIRSAHDIGWMRNLTVGRMMRHDIRTTSSQTTVAEFRAKFPLGSTQRVIAIDPQGHYVGMVLVPEAHAPERDSDADATPVNTILHYQDDVLVPSMTVKEAVGAFDKSESEALAVVDGLVNRQVVGLLTEAHAMRRYAEELDKVRRGLSGEA
jgi:CIC family chloride channel protein